MSNSNDTQSKVKSLVSKSTISIAITLLILIAIVVSPVLLLGAQTYFWALTHSRQVKMLQSDYSNYDNQYKLQSPLQ